MSTTLLGQKSLSASIQQTVGTNFNQDGTYTRTYIVQADDECDDEYSVLFGTAGLPNINDRSDIYPALRVSSRVANEIAPRFWEVTITWTLPDPPQPSGGGGGGGGGSKSHGVDWGLGPGAPVRDQTPPPGFDKVVDRVDPLDAPLDLPPWERPARLTITSSKKKHAITHAYYFGMSENGSPSRSEPWTFDWTKDENMVVVDDSGFRQISFTNSAGQQFYYDTDRFVLQITNEKSMRNPDFAYFFQRVGTVNLNTLQLSPEVPLFPPGTLLWDDLSMSEEYWSDPETGELFGYWNVRITYEYDYLYHCIPVADIGTKYFAWESTGVNSGTGDRRHRNAPESTAFTFKNADDEITEGALNGMGGKDTDGRINHLFYMPYRIMAW